MQDQNCFQKLNKQFLPDELPNRFSFPFYYTPHPLSLMAVNELQVQLLEQNEWNHNFGLKESEKNGIGKMFGVLVVKNSQNDIGYIAAYSGKLAKSNHLPIFVPPVFDMLQPESFYLKGQLEISQINDQIKSLEKNLVFNEIKNRIKRLKKQVSLMETDLRKQLIESRKIRKEKRKIAQNHLLGKKLKLYLDSINLESMRQKSKFKKRKESEIEKIHKEQQTYDIFDNEIIDLKKYRKNFSGKLQDELFRNYSFLSSTGERKNLLQIFTESGQGKPPAAAGECAAPKLLHYAYSHQLKPISLAEFWWGQSPASAIRKHKNFYPSCQGKCKPILNHMLKGIDIDPNPLLINQAENKHIKIIYEDENILIIDKPAELLSVPGKTMKDSVYHRIKERFPKITGPVIVHRLDMSTSGLMMIAKNKGAHKHLQKQFIDNKIKKIYIAILEGVLAIDKGEINLPIRLDIDDRPRQLVCEIHGKPSKTKWKVLGIKNNRTKVSFEPITGRTHQLRVHSAHKRGLDMPILGDDLYGTKSDRLYLHAQHIEFQNPQTKEQMKFDLDADF